MTISEVEFFARGHCDYPVSFWTAYLVLVHYASYVITVGLVVVGLKRKESWLLCLALGLTANWAFNYLLKAAFRLPVPNGTCGNYAFFCDDPLRPGTSCSSPSLWPWAAPADPLDVCVPCGMPSYEVQQTSFFITAIFIYTFQWRAPRFRQIHSLVLVAWYAMVVYAHVFFGFADAFQAIVGAFVGAVFALVWVLGIFAFAYPRFDTIAQWRIFTFAGPYVDTITRSEPPLPGDPPAYYALRGS